MARVIGDLEMKFEPRMNRMNADDRKLAEISSRIVAESNQPMKIRVYPHTSVVPYPSLDSLFHGGGGRIYLEFFSNPTIALPMASPTFM